MTTRLTPFTTIRTEGALLPADLLQRISEGANIDGLTPESYHHSGEKLNEAINRSWNALQGVWANFRAGQEKLPESDLGTTLTRERWLLPLFRELDYGRLPTAPTFEIDGRSYPISHAWANVPIHLISFRLDLDKRTPGVAGASTASPHSLVQVFLNRSPQHHWGFLSNGLKLRILRDNASLTRQAYVEFDLEAMMSGEVYSDFVLLWLLCHQSRVEGEKQSDLWLEKWMKTAADQGTRALDQLRDGVEAAITALGRGFLEHPANAALRDRLTSGDLTGQDTYRQLLRLVYRLLFLFVAEDRDLLLDPNASPIARERYVKYYSTARLRTMAATFKGTRHPDLFEGLRLVMRLLSGDDSPRPEGEGLGVRVAQGLALMPLGSFLFSDGAVADVIDCQISNAALLEAVRALSLTYDTRTRAYRTVDYRNLGPEELGSIYESLLELHPQINVSARSFALATAGGNERKTTGSYYTPTSLINALLDSALDPVIEEAIRARPEDKTLTPNPSGEKAPTPNPSGEKAPTPNPSGGKAPTPNPSGEKAPTPNPSPSGGGESVRAMANKAMRDIARNLRQRQTPAEQIVWEALRKNRLGGLGFRRQHPIANTAYVVDFFCYSANLIVELDGEIHQFQQSADEKRQTELEQLGYRVMRFANERIHTDLENVLIEILSAAHTQVPPPEGEGFRVGASTAEQRLLALKICDPACGSGHFLIAAAQRMAKKLAEIRTGEEEPPPAAVQEAKRDIIGHCIYGVDINPMAVELCKVNLWMEALEPGKPLSFLDHRILVGNSLLGTTPALMANGIPDDAFNPIEGDDKADASRLKKLNRQERKARETGQRSMFELIDPPADYRAITAAVRELDSIDDDTLDGLRRKEQAYAELESDPERQKALILADAWCAAFVWDKSPHPPTLTPSPHPPALTPSPSPSGRGESVPPMTDLQYRQLEKDPLNERFEPVRRYVQTLQRRYQFFHWHVAFPDVFGVPSPPVSPSPSGRGGSPHPQTPSPSGRGDFNEQTGWSGGFSCVLGNPPWEHTEIKEQEWFAERSPEIAAAPGATRKRLIAALEENDPVLFAAFRADLREADAFAHFTRASGHFPLTARGRVNTYPLFAESSRLTLSERGRMGMIVPSGIATDDTTKFFFQDLMQSGSLVSLYDFENREGLFPAVDSRMKFCLLTLRSPHSPAPSLPQGERGASRAASPLSMRERGFRGEGLGAEFAFFALSVADLADPDKCFTLSAADIALLNPNTGTTATFRSQRDAEITKAIYRRIPVLIREEPLENPWGISFKQGLFNMTSDSHLFRTAQQLFDQGGTLDGNRFYLPSPPTPLPQGEGLYLPLYEAKLMHQFDHRWATYATSPRPEGEGHGGEGFDVRDFTSDEKRDPSALVMPRYWVDEHAVTERIGGTQWMLGFRDIARSTDERTALFSVVPRFGSGNTLILVFSEIEASLQGCLIACLNSSVTDYVVRQKVSGTHLTYNFVKQFAIVPPHTYTPALLDFIVPRVLELTYTAWDLQAFAQDVGYPGAPFIWDDERRFLMRCELDALYFHLYQISREDVDYIMETFPIAKRKDVASYGSYRTKETIMAMYDQMAALPKLAVPAPKSPPRPEGEGDLGGEGTYLVSDVSQWVTWLNPPPADPGVAHKD